ncbi:hypothetical protein [Nocardia sp. CY41]|uniref:hypothetical protein n=1 Tax=Nocardia sp. CY41 TaxID=2608686 RepID=UPI001359750A|nr:hypothetical protein [Nocardia sp. CY41]
MWIGTLLGQRVRGQSPWRATVDSELTGTGAAAAERRRPRGSHAIAVAAAPNRTITIIVTTHQTNTVIASLAAPSVCQTASAYQGGQLFSSRRQYSPPPGRARVHGAAPTSSEVRDRFRRGRRTSPNAEIFR